MRNTLTVEIKGVEYGEKGSNFSPDDNQEFNVGDRVVVTHYFDSNGNEWNNAEHLEIVRINNRLEKDEIEDEVEKWVSGPSYGNNGITCYTVGIKTVSRVFKTKIWVK